MGLSIGRLPTLASLLARGKQLPHPNLKKGNANETQNQAGGTVFGAERMQLP